MERVKSYYERKPEYEYPRCTEEYSKAKESLSSEDKRKKELIFIAESLLRKKKRD